MSFNLLRSFKLALNNRASIEFIKKEQRFLVDKKINGCDCEKTVIKVDLSGKTIFLDLDDTILHNDFAEEIFPEYFDGTDAFNIKLNVLKQHYQRLSDFSPEAFDWEDMSFRASKSEKFPELYSLQEKYYVWPFVYKIRGASLLLKTLKRLGCKIYAYTNGYSKYQKRLLQKLDMEEFFEGIISPDIMGVSKVDFFKNLKIEMKELVVVGDDYFYDVEVPSSYGVLTIWVYKYKKGPVGSPITFPDYSFYDLTSFLNALKS